MRRHSHPNAFVLNSGGFQGQAGANRPPQQEFGEQGNFEPTTHAALKVDTGYYRCEEQRSFYPYLNYEVVKVQATDRRNAHCDIFHILNFPIDQLSEHVVEEATRLPNLRSIAFCDPLSWQVFRDNYAPIMGRALDILRRVPSLTKITLCVDILDDQLFHALGSQLNLRSLEILLPSATYLAFRDGLAQTGEVLSRGIVQLPQVEYFKIPIEIVHCLPPECANYITSIRWRPWGFKPNASMYLLIHSFLSIGNPILVSLAIYFYSICFNITSQITMLLFPLRLLCFPCFPCFFFPSCIIQWSVLYSMVNSIIVQPLHATHCRRSNRPNFKATACQDSHIA